MTHTGSEFYCHFLKCNIGFGVQCLWCDNIEPDHEHDKMCKHKEQVDSILTQEVDWDKLREILM